MVCPNCKNKLTFIQAIPLKPEWVRNADPNYDYVELQYNCEECTYDYKIELGIHCDSAELKPIFWG